MCLIWSYDEFWIKQINLNKVKEIDYSYIELVKRQIFKEDILINSGLFDKQIPNEQFWEAKTFWNYYQRIFTSIFGKIQGQFEKDAFFIKYFI